MQKLMTFQIHLQKFKSIQNMVKSEELANAID